IPVSARLEIWPDRDPSRAVRVWPEADIPAEGEVQEAGEHLFVLTGAPDAADSELLIDDLPLEALRTNAVDQARWRWTPGFHAGQVEARLVRPSGSVRFEFVTDPAVRKLTRDAFDRMVRETLEDTFALFSLSAFRTGVARGAGSRPPPIARLEFLRSRLPELKAAVQAIDGRPRRLLRAEVEIVPVHRAARATAPEVLRSFRSGRLLEAGRPERLPERLQGRMPAAIRRSVRRVSQDLPAHRQMKASLETWARWLEAAARLLNRQDADPSAAIWARRTRRMAREVRGLLGLEVFQGVGEGAPRPDGAPIWRSDPRYRRFARLHRDMTLGIAAVFGDFLQMPLARTFDLYELWAYLRLARAAVERWGASAEDVAALFEPGSGITLSAGGARLELPGAGLSLSFQRRFREYWLEKDGRGSFSREMRPDIVVERLGEGKRDLIVLDAKYRIGADLNDALSSTHMYRDALVSDGGRGEPRRLVRAAYLVTPAAPTVVGDWRSAPMPGRLFHPEYRGTFSFGAVALTPGMSPEAIADALDLILADAGAAADVSRAP
ncbi:MAG: DUF2357 domain-containing protein, partial [Brevundimonas sp.]